MKKVGANSDIHWVLFDEENMVAGFHTNSEGLWMIYEISVNYVTEILSLRLEITVCILVEIEFPVPDRLLSLLKLRYRLPVSLGLLVKSVNFESTDTGKEKSLTCRLHVVFRSKRAGSPGGGVIENFLNDLYLGSKINLDRGKEKVVGTKKAEGRKETRELEAGSKASFPISEVKELYKAARRVGLGVGTSSSNRGRVGRKGRSSLWKVYLSSSLKLEKTLPSVDMLCGHHFGSLEASHYWASFGLTYVMKIELKFKTMGHTHFFLSDPILSINSLLCVDIGFHIVGLCDRD
uniref:Uncharacterized protein n=1 Tax=Cucumis melo TaxID=3656 RepID=A0A9I9EM91_CUCME